MKLKTLEVDGKTYAEVQDGKPVYLADDGKTIAFDAPTTVATISRLNGEAKSHREAKEAAEAKLKAFDGITDAEAARKALEITANLDSGQLVAAGKVDEIKAAAKKAAEDQVANAVKAANERVKELETNYNKIQSDLYGEKVGGAFSRSKFIADKVAVPSDLVQAMFGQRFKVEDGKIVGYDAAGNKLFSRSKPGEIADFDESLEMLVDSYANRDAILKGTGNSGSGTRESNGTGGGKSMSRTAFEALDPGGKAKAMADKVALVD